MTHITRSFQRSLRFTLLAALVLLLSATIRRSSSVVVAAPAGLSAADWQAIQAQLPFGSTASITGIMGQQAYVKAANTGTGDYFGFSVAVDGDTVVVGAPFEDSGTSGVNTIPNEAASESGAAYVFVRSGTIWTQQAYLKAANTGAGDSFGLSVAVDGDIVVIGGLYEDSSTTGINSMPNEAALDAGAAYVFGRTGTTWTQQAYLKASNPGVNDNFGLSVGVQGNTVVIGAAFEDSSTSGVNTVSNELALDAGAAYVFGRTGTTWTQQAYLKASNPQSDDQFGWSVAMDNDTVVIGARNEDSSTSGINTTPDEAAESAGAVYVFRRDVAMWTQQAYLKASNTETGDQFGFSVAVAGETVVVGANLKGAADTGAAYVFIHNGITWMEQAYLKASNPGAFDNFGESVGIYGDTVAVGAWNEDSSSSGVNTLPNESAPNSGAAYVFGRNGITWTQQSYLKASNSGTGDSFGWRVAVGGDTIVVGAQAEDSGTSGINTPPNEAVSDAGAMYVFSSKFSNALWLPLILK